MPRDFFDDPQWRKGYAFEKWVVDRFPPRHFELVDWTSDKEVAGRRPRSAGQPDLLFEYRFRSSACNRIAIECKWRDVFPYDRILAPHQLNNYRKFSREEQVPVSIVLGVGDTADSPKKVYIIPLERFASESFTPARAKEECYRVKSAKRFYVENGILT